MPRMVLAGNEVVQTVGAAEGEFAHEFPSHYVTPQLYGRSRGLGYYFCKRDVTSEFEVVENGGSKMEDRGWNPKELDPVKMLAQRRQVFLCDLASLRDSIHDSIFYPLSSILNSPFSILELRLRFRGLRPRDGRGLLGLWLLRLLWRHHVGHQPVARVKTELPIADDFLSVLRPAGPNVVMILPAPLQRRRHELAECSGLRSLLPVDPDFCVRRHAHANHHCILILTLLRRAWPRFIPSSGIP